MYLLASRPISGNGGVLKPAGSSCEGISTSTAKRILARRYYQCYTEIIGNVAEIITGSGSYEREKIQINSTDQTFFALL